MRNFIEIIVAFCTGVFAFFINAPFTRFLFSYTYKYTNIIYDSLKHIPCDQGSCKLRLFVSLLIFIIRDTLFVLPIGFVFGLLFGIILKYYRLSRPVILCLGFFAAQYSYNVINSVVSDLPLYVEIARALPIILLFIYFTKFGHSLRLKIRFQKIAKAIQSEEEQEESQTKNKIGS